MEVRKAVGLCEILIAGGTFNLPCGPSVTVVARNCALQVAFDGFVVLIADTRATVLQIGSDL